MFTIRQHRIIHKIILEMYRVASRKNGDFVNPNTNLLNLFISTQFGSQFLPNDNAKHFSHSPVLKMWIKYPKLNFGGEPVFRQSFRWAKFWVGFGETSYMIHTIQIQFSCCGWFSNERSMWQLKCFLSLCYALLTTSSTFSTMPSLIWSWIICYHICLTGFYVSSFSRGYLLFFEGVWLSFQIKFVSYKYSDSRPDFFLKLLIKIITISTSLFNTQTIQTAKFLIM